MSGKHANWTSVQLKRLKECYAATPWADLEREFAPHTLKSIITKANRQGLKRKPSRDWMAIASAHVPVLTFGIARRG
jgi:hypothetical protein